jgi:peptidase M28-like protein
VRTRGIAFLVTVTLTAVTLATVVQTLPPAPLPANAPAAEFSAERAVEHIRVIAKQPRPTGSIANAAARNYILAVLKDLGLETETQRDGDLENVVGRIGGTRSPDAILLTAHLDSVSEGPGATDDGSGVAVLLETARALVSEGALPNTVMFLFTDFEEGGSIGARAFIATHPWARDVRIVIGFDAGGLSGPAVLSATSTDNGWLIRKLAQADPYVAGSSAINALADSGTDFGHGFKTAGYPGYAFDLYWDRRIHTPEDNIGNLNLSSLQHQGYHALSLAHYFGNLKRLADPREPDAVYFSVLRLFTVTYPSTWAIPLTVAVAGIFWGVLAFGLRRQILTWGGMGYGMFVLLAGIIIAPLPGILLGNWGHGVPLRYLGRPLDRPPQVGIVVLLALVLTVLWYELARRFRSTSVPDLTMGALGLMLVCMAGTSIAFPALSFAFTWPLLLSLLACANWFYWHARQKNSKMVFGGLLFSGAASIVILGPTILLGLFDQMPLTLLLLGVLCGFIAPLIHLMVGYTIENQGPAQETSAA